MNEDEIKYILQNSDFIEKHIFDDPVKLLFKYSKDDSKKLLITQIACRQKIRKKLPSWYQNYNLVFWPGLSIEQSSSEDTGTIKASLISGKQLLDITGGMGVDTFFLSQNFDTTTYVEKNSELFSTTSHNLASLSKRIKCVNYDGVKTLKESSADVIYLDPYRRDGGNNKMVSLADCEPNVLELKPWLTQNGRIALIKASPMLDIHKAISELDNVSEVWIISSRNECKEVIFKLEEVETSKIYLRTFNVYPNHTEHFDFELNQISNKDISFSEPLNYLYEPNASILKSGGQDLLPKNLALYKLHPNSNFFTSSEYIKNFPGKTFKITELVSPFHSSLKKGRFNVISRNFPKKASEIEKKLKLLSDKENYLIATKGISDKYLFIKATLLSSPR